MDKVEKLWNLIINYGYDIRINNLNGLEKWNMVKPKLMENKIKGKWKPSALLLYDQIRELNIIDEKPEGMSHDEWEKHHFYIQHGRIPFKNKEDQSLTRLLQIAFNTGQLSYLMNYKQDSFLTHILKRYYYNNQLNNPLTYMDYDSLIGFNINDQFIDEITQIINKEQSGGILTTEKCKVSKKYYLLGK